VPNSAIKVEEVEVASADVKVTSTRKAAEPARRHIANRGQTGIQKLTRD